MKTIPKLSLLIVFSILIAACSDTTSPTEDPVIKTIGELETPYVTTMNVLKKNDQIMENEVDSIKIIRIRILMSEMKLFAADDNSEIGKVIKTDPFVYDLSLTGGLTVLSENEVSAGTYDKVKLEFHRFSASQLNEYENELVFKDFATADRYSIIIEGITYKADNPSTFVFKSQMTANLSLMFEPPISLNNGSHTTLSISLNPNFFFKKWGSIIDPADPKNLNDIENTIKNTMKAIKK